MTTQTVNPSDQSRALWLSTFAFTMCFAVWTIFAIIGIQIQKDLGLSDTQFVLLAALGVGIAGGSFSVGIAYVSKWFSRERQGIALGIFGAGNVGAALTKFAAPIV